MRKITLLFLLLTISFSVKAQFTEGFESGIPSDWTVINNGSANGWVQNTSPSGGAFEGTSVASITYNSTAHDDYLITPAITVATGTNDFLSFSVKSRSSSYLEPYEVLLSTTDTMESSFTTVLQASSEAPNAWVLNSFDLSSYNGQTVYVAIKATGTNEFALYVDDVFNGVQATPPNCATDPIPADSATDVTFSGSTTIAWTAPATGDAPSTYEIFWGTTSGSLSSIGTTSETTTNITGIDFSTTYYWMIVPQNNGGSATGCAEWSFTTEDTPPAPANDLPTGAIALTLDEGTDCGANVITGITNQSTTDSGVAAPMCGSYGTPTTQGDLWYTFVAPASGSLTLNAHNSLVISSVAGAFYSGIPGSLTEEGCTEFASGWPWLLSGLTAGDTYYLRVWDYGNDHIGTFDLCGYYSTCPAPTGVSVTPSAATEADVAWTAGGTETNWTYEYGVTGFTLGNGTSAMTTSSSVTLTSLTAGTEYDVYIQANCTGADDSAWTTKVTWTQTYLANNTLAGAIPITPSAAGTGCATTGFTLNFSTDGTTDSGMDGTCNTTDTGLDQFFTWTATTDGLIFNSDTPLVGNPGIVIRDTSGTEIICAGTFADNAILSGWAIGDDLIIQIYDYGTSMSDVAFCLEEYTIPPPPANDDCANATGVGSLPFNETLDATSATNNAGFIAQCGGMNDGVWYTFTTINAGTIDIAITGVTGWDPKVALYSGSCGTFTCVDSVDGGASGDSETLSGVSVDANTQYWINIGYYGSSSDSSEGPFTIDITTSDTTTVLKVESNSIENFTLFPTIVKDKLSFSSQEKVDALTIYNIMGQEVFSRKPAVTNASINVASLSSGMYIVKVKAGNSLGSYKIIKE